MSLLYDETTSAAISYHLSLESSSNVTQIKSVSLDGTVYLQTIGSPQTDYTGKVYVDREGKALLEAAYANGDLLRAEVKHGTYHGRLTDIKFSDRNAGDTFETTITLAKEVTA